MDTKEVATRLCTETRILRRFLRDAGSGWQTVGSGSRYTFKEEQLEDLGQAFTTWLRARPSGRATQDNTPNRQDLRDQEVWAEEAEARRRAGHDEKLTLPDIRDPRVRADVRRRQLEQEARLEQRLMAAGLHITQLRAS